MIGRYSINIGSYKAVFIRDEIFLNIETIKFQILRKFSSSFSNLSNAGLST